MKLLRRVVFLLRARRHAAELAAELEDHRTRAQAALEANGLTVEDAARHSRRAMGNVALAREDARDVWIAAWLHQAWRDAVYGGRALRREPTFAVTALVTLALGMATTMTVFSVADAELWRPLPFPDPQELVAVHWWRPGAHADTQPVSGPDYLDWRAQSRLVEYAAEGQLGRRVLRRRGAESVLVEAVTANYFEVLNHVPRIGRAFKRDDDRAQVALLSDRGWRRLFDADPTVLGRSVSLDGTEYTIVGVDAGQHLEIGSEPDVFITFDPGAAAYQDRLGAQLGVIGRLLPGVSLVQGQAELQAVAARIAKNLPQGHVGYRIEFSDLKSASSGYNWRPLVFFLAAAIVVFALSCLNVANLLLSRALRRQREFAIRGALGGSVRALGRQLLVEGALLAVPAALVAGLLSAWALRLVAIAIPAGYLERGGHVTLDGRIAGVVVAIAAATTLVLALAPMVFARRVGLSLMLGQGNRTAGRSPAQRRSRGALLVAQLTLTLVLTVAAALFGISFMKQLRAPLGFDPQGRASVRLMLSGPRFEGDVVARRVADRLVERARAVPGAIDAAIGTSAPLSSGPIVRLVAADRQRPAPGDEPSALVRGVTADYFRTLGIQLNAGRAFNRADVAGSPRVAIVSEYLGQRLFPGENPLGRSIELVPGARTPWTRRPGIVLVVGVAPNVKDVGINEVEFGDLYLPFAQAPGPGMELLVRSTGSAPMAQALRQVVADVEPDLPVSYVDALTDRVDGVLRGDRFNLLLIGGFAAVAIVLAAVGIYGAMACAVQERTREFGVRLALGQQPSALVRRTLWESARYGVVGSLSGLAIVMVLARVLGNALYLVRGQHNGMLYGVTTTDPAAIATAAAALIAVATVSGLVPSRQATRVDPLIALRSE
jgi:putative ABC transport system permease protein